MIATSLRGVRPPAVAGLFYPEIPGACRQMARQLIDGAPRHATPAPGGIGALVPHAGWICSGEVAAEAMVHLAGAGPGAGAGQVARRVDLVVVFGAMHAGVPVARGVLDSHAQWSLPGGALDLPEAVQQALLGSGGPFMTDGRLHQGEHAIEVQIPLLQTLWPGAAILPMGVGPESDAVAIGRATARVVSDLVEVERGRVIFLASSDLTHYGASYGLLPAGTGPRAMEWAMSNDQRLLQLIQHLKADQIVEEARTHLSACGAGAIAAMLGACLELGATAAHVLRHTSSYQTLQRIQPQAGDLSVGYAAVVIQ